MSATEEQIAAEMTPDELDEEQGDEENAAAPESEEEQAAPEPAAAAPRSQKEIDQLTEKLQREAERHAKRIEEIMGEDFALLVPSPVDWTPGYIFNVPEMHPTPEQVAEFHTLLGGSAPVELREAEDAEGCDKCNALGEVLTGSRKPGQETKPCVACTGTGWKTKALPPPQSAPVVPFPTTNGTTEYAPNQPIVADRWGRQWGHRDYGIDPSLVNA